MSGLLVPEWSNLPRAQSGLLLWHSCTQAWLVPVPFPLSMLSCLPKERHQGKQSAFEPSAGNPTCLVPPFHSLWSVGTRRAGVQEPNLLVSRHGQLVFETWSPVLEPRVVSTAALLSASGTSPGEEHKVVLHTQAYQGGLGT